MDTHLPPGANRTNSGGFKTSEGTLYVSRPYRSKTSKKLRALITFAPRKSHFDIGNETSGMNEFRGFFSLFWISIFIFTVRVYVRGIESSGRPLNLGFAAMFSQDAIVLAISDAVLALSTWACLPFAFALKKGWIRYYWVGVTIQHILQTAILVSAITWTFDRKWPWVQSGFFTLHSLVMIMKMHSYITVNGQLQVVNKQSEEVLKHLRETTQSVGGWDQAIKDAKAYHAEVDTTSGLGSSSPSTSASGTPATPPNGSTTSYTDVATANALRKRLTTISQATNGNIAVVDVPANQAQAAVAQPEGSVFEAHPLVDHPDKKISELAKEYSDLRGELTSPGPTFVTWPNNITFKNFADFLFVPTLVYELEYPRTDRIRPIYVFEKTVATFGTFALLYTVTETFILPYTPTNDQSILRSLLDLALPFMMAYLLLFFIIFECICNGFAELSHFADRQFYEDWYGRRLAPTSVSADEGVLEYRWNSTSWDEFSRKWNKPVHAFLLRHVYAPTILGYGLSRTWAMFLTFLLSASVHELVMIIVTQKFRFYLFVLQIVQIPLIVISRIPMVKRNKLLGNIVFWLGLYAGFPLLCVAYVAY
ncbi:MBOAT, membrane-bound O-acyltransferase family-domain-containing protein [Lyophyllum atratum]|nr:MBOAT, membrane-bound O-acyltransferase family-domain-containing protein [Lyophyllum atratum]